MGTDGMMQRFLCFYSVTATTILLHQGVWGQLSKLKCKSNIRGGNYAGDVSTTRTGLTCQRWDAQYPHSHDVTDSMMADGSLRAADNFCRSPNFDPGGPWCFTTDPDIMWDYCDVPVCDDIGCIDSAEGSGYIGQAARTVTGYSCTLWSDVFFFSAYGWIYLDSVRFPDGKLNHNLCRNPLGDKERPWCYSANPDADWEFCDIDLCPRQYAAELTTAVLPTRGCQQQGGVCIQKHCCTDNYYVSGLCGDDDAVCCLSQEDCQWAQEEELTWPSGSYSLPTPVFGCPNDEYELWRPARVSIRQAADDAVTWSYNFRLAGPYTSRDVNLQLCERQEALGPPSANTWPPGRYCLYRAAEQPCPNGFTTIDFVMTSPGVSSSTTIAWNRTCDTNENSLCIEICCKEDGDHNTAIHLPTKTPFLLLKLGGGCQQVAGMGSSIEKLNINLGPGVSYSYSGRPRDDLPFTFNGQNLTLNLCYYESNAEETCWNPMDRGLWYRGLVNMTSEGPCVSWINISKIDHDKHYQHVGLDDTNFCRNTLLFHFEDRPWCYVGGRKVHCEIPECDESYFDDVIMVGEGRPARQQHGDWAEAQLVVDGDPLTCSFQLPIRAWWQVDLQGMYTVSALSIYRQNVDVCVLRFVNIHVGRDADDFLTQGSLLCARNVSVGSMEDGVVRCTQPVRGQHLTIDNIVYLESETYTELYEKCLVLCEVKVYVKDTFCGRRLLERTMVNQIQPYMKDDTGRQEDAAPYTLHSHMSWCLMKTDNAPATLMINLLFARRIQSVIIQGNQEGDGMITSFRMKFGFSESDLIYYEEYPGIAKIFMNDPMEAEPQSHHLLTDITASIVVIEPLTDNGKPCVRLDFLGCIKEFDNLVSLDAVSQSSEIPTGPVQYSADNDVSTCGTTKPRLEEWWRLDLKSDFRIHTVAVETGVLFAWNLAGGKPSSALSEGWSGWSWRANDGRVEAANYWLGSCSTTVLHMNPWWSVDLGRDYNITTVVVTNRDDCCNQRLDTFYVLIGDSSPERGEPINIDDYRVCDLHDRYFAAGATHVVNCGSAGITGRFVFLVIPHSEYLTICEVQVFGERDRFLVGVSGEAEVDWSEESALCRPQNEIGLGRSTHVFNCGGTAPGRHLVSTVRGLGSMSVCSALVYGGRPATLRAWSYGEREFAHISCAEGASIVLQWTQAQGATTADIRLERRHLAAAMSLCTGRQACRLPAPPPGVNSKNVVSANVVCSATRSTEEKCNVALSREGRIETPNFPFYYGADVQCAWTVTAPPGQFVVFNTSTFSVAPKVQNIEDGCLEFNMGICEDAATVSYSDEGKAIPMTSAALFVSDSNYLTLRFKSCFRQVADVRTGTYGINAAVSFETCAGCASQFQTTSATCSGPCGHIVSYGYPAAYKPNERMEWTITVDKEKFISLSFVGFDVYEHVLLQCERDYVLVYDVGLLGERTSPERFCNSDPPRASLISSWFSMVIEFVTDATDVAKGFHAVYEQKTYQPPEDIPFVTDHQECPHQWLWFDYSCYNLERSDSSLTWQDAEDSCQSKGTRGHLVSIANHKEMTFLHYMLSTRWRSNETSTFIGLTDSGEEGNWRWSDDSPVTYSAWSSLSDYSNLRQPDGAEVEDCAMIRLDSIHSTNSWHDIPCAYDKVLQFLCEVDVDDIEQAIPSRSVTAIVVEEKTSNTAQCENGELIHSYRLCDGTVDCRDASDETNCTIVAGGCPETNFMCADGTCISMTLFCDFKSDCVDNSDESRCIKPLCSEDEFRCANGECIRAEQQCDLLNHCKDASDELHCVRCSDDFAFQCFDGTCISANKRCDQVVDCPGALHEDESEDCVAESIQPSCRAWKLAGSTANAKYLINPGGQGTFEVECDMTSDPQRIVTVLHHDSENRIYVTGYPNPGSYIHAINYAASIEQIKAMKLEVEQCEQYVRLECYGAAGTTDDFWVNIDSVRVPWILPTDSACKCSLSAACEANRSRCWCEDSETSVPRIEVEDSGTLSSFPDLPMTAISLSGTSFKDQQYQYHTVGPLTCYQGGNVSRDEIRCGSGRFVDQRHRCMYDVNARGDVLGCRDAAHLENCADFTCPQNSFKCQDNFCIPLRMVCDSSQDCLNGDDEIHCNNFSCTGMYKCHGQDFCVETAQLCDGERQCPLGDDEELCYVTCPAAECRCLGLTFLCPYVGFRVFPPTLPYTLRKLDMTGNMLADLTQHNISQFMFLGELLLGSNGIRVLEPFTFANLSNLYKLDLSNNLITALQRNTFSGLVSLTQLVMSGNSRLMTIETGAFLGLQALPELQLKNLALSEVQRQAFIGMPALRSLDLSINQLGLTPAGLFLGLESLLVLNVSGNAELSMMKTVLDDLVRLEFLQSDSFKYCCFVADRLPEEKCLPARDELSSCEDLMRRDVLKAFLWFLGLMALLCNAFVLAWRAREKFTVYSFSVFNLAAADLLMGIYMVTLAIVDIYYRGVYIEYVEEWTQSWLCQVLGFLNTLSSEASVFILCLISGDRFYNIVFPFKALSGGKSGLGKSIYVMAAVWSFAFLLAAIPLFPLDYFKGGYYSRSGMCISIYLTNEKTPGWEFSVFIFHILNFCSFMFIFMSYAYMYRVVVASSRSSTGKAKANESEIKLAQRMTLVVATDFLCWVPINVMGALALGGMRIPGEVYAWVVVFLLPVNSAINPLLYTISAISLMKKSKAKQGQQVSQPSTTSQLFYVHSSESGRTLREFLGQQAQLPLAQAVRIIRALTYVLVDAHGQQRVLPGLDVSTTVLLKTEVGIKVGVQIIQQQANTVLASPHEDINALGKIISAVLRRSAKSV